MSRSWRPVLGASLSLLAFVLMPAAAVSAAEAVAAAPATEPAAQASSAALTPRLRVRQALALDAVVPNARLFVPREPFTARLVRGEFRPPQAGARFAAGVATSPAWRAVTVGADGTVADDGVAKGGTLYLAVDSPRDQVLLLDARGAGWVWIDGSLRAGDIYADGSLRLPVALRAGINHVLLRGGRGKPRLQWHPAPATPFIHDQDFTLPDMVEDGFDGERFVGAAVVINPTPHWTPPLVLRARQGEPEAVETVVDPIPPLAHRKVPFAFEASRIAPEQHDPARLRLRQHRPSHGLGRNAQGDRRCTRDPGYRFWSSR
jgi:hypothetical protein